MANVVLVGKWLAKHPNALDEYAGKWVAIGERGVVAVADTLKSLLSKPGVDPKSMVVDKVPTPEELAGVYLPIQEKEIYRLKKIKAEMDSGKAVPYSRNAF